MGYFASSELWPPNLVMMDIELDEGCNAAHLVQKGCMSTSDQQRPLYRYDELPSFLKFNPYIRKGYRAYLPASQCIFSIFQWNNESMNIWTHLVGFMVFFFSMFSDNALILMGSGGKLGHYSDHFFITMGLLCYQACMILSTGYHIFFCHSEKACMRWLGLDLAGISIGLIGCYLPAIHLAFYCYQIWRDVYMLVIFVLGFITLGVQFHPQFLSHSWNKSRIVLYSSVAGYGIIPSLHWIYLDGGFQSEIVQLFYSKIIVIYALGLLALIFYLSKFPERLLPGRVDFIGSSHQWWHIIVVIAFVYWHRAGEEILEYRINHSCVDSL